MSQEIFYGPWRLKLVKVDPHFVQRFRIRGSDNNLDGPREIAALNDVFDQLVTGAVWSIVFEMRPFPPVPNPPWNERTVPRATFVAPVDGLTVRFESKVAPHLVLDCICMDRTINPKQRRNPYDFTYPG